MSGDLLALGVVAAVAAAGLARRGSRGLVEWSYTIYSESEYDDDDYEYDPDVDGEFLRTLDLADDDEVWEVLGIDPERVEIPDWMRAAVSFLEILLDVGAFNYDADGWSTDWKDLEHEPGAYRETYDLANAMVRDLRGLHETRWPSQARDFINCVLRHRMIMPSDLRLSSPKWRNLTRALLDLLSTTPEVRKQIVTMRREADER